MKEKELRKHLNCSNCRKPIGHTGLPFFWTATINRYGIDMRAVKAQDGLSAFLGNAYLAQVMGPDQDMAKKVADEITITLCEDCAIKRVVFAELAFDNGSEEEDDDE